MNPSIDKAYNPESVEQSWYQSWIDNHCFRASPNPDKQPNAIMIPPPNVTGVLTMGHVLNNTIQDILARRARQLGKETLWLPGTDHAGIATQTKVVKSLADQGTHFRDLGREQFIEKAKQWRDKHGGIILKQLKALGASCDWSRTKHTLDPDYSQAVLTSFVTLYNRGYIYRGKRMVNWCPVSLTALSDEEVIMQPQSSLLYKVQYEIAESPGEFITIATTRPETIMGDSAVAIHPDDERYKHLHGKHLIRPLNPEKIPVILDDAVEIDFGTGALKVTPAHDPLDFEIGQRHNLPIIDIMNPDGTLSDKAGPDFAGLERFEARKAAAKKLEELGKLSDTEQHQNNVGFSERAGVPIEPRLSEQFFLKYPKIEEAKNVVKQGLIQFYPERWAKTYLHWLDNIQDWCISRQLWWGHRIPVWYKKDSDRADTNNWHVSVEGPADPENWEQEEDVLDTWASSWLWPFATLGWPDTQKAQEQGLEYFYPTSDLVTGPDIIFFWVARMIMAGLEFMGEDTQELSESDLKARIPFNTVYFTGIIRDMQGRKMSKSLGNSPDPLDLIAKYGADGLRYAIISIAPKGQDILFSEDRVSQGRNFCNKLWNAARFRQMSGDSFDNSSLEKIIERIDPSKLDAGDHALLANLCSTLDSVNAKLNDYEFNAAVQEIYSFFWTFFCDWYVEVSKAKLKDEALKNNVLALQDLALRQVLLLLHPFTPFITEELFHKLGYAAEGEFIQNFHPGTGKDLQALGLEIDQSAASEIENLREFVSQARALKAQYNLASKKDVHFTLTPESNGQSVIQNNTDQLLKLIGADNIQIADKVEDSPAIVTPLGTLYIDLKGAIDVGAEKSRLEKELSKLNKQVAAGESKLSNEAFVSKAPAHILEGAKSQLAETVAKRDEVERLLKAL